MVGTVAAKESKNFRFAIVEPERPMQRSRPGCEFWRRLAAISRMVNHPKNQQARSVLAAAPVARTKWKPL